MPNLEILTISQLQALTANPPLAKAYYTSDLGKEGEWYHASSTPSTQNMGTVINDAGGNTWRRLIEDDQIRPEWFGALGNGTSNDTTAINNAIKAAVGRKVYFSEEKVYMVNEVEVVNAVTLTGGGTLKKIVSSTRTIAQQNFPVIGIKEGVKDVTIEGITIDGNRSEVALYSSDDPEIFPDFRESLLMGIYGVSLVNTFIERLTVKNVTIQNTWREALYIDCANDVKLLSSKIVNCQQAGFIDSSGISRTTAAVYITCTGNKFIYKLNFKNVEVSDCYFDQSGNFNGCIKIQAVAGHTLSNVQVRRNQLFIADQKIIVPVVPGVEEVADQVGIIGVEIHSTSSSVSQTTAEKEYGTQKNVYVCDNTITCTPQTTLNEAHDFGISVAGTSGGTNPRSKGIIGALISNNQIIDCHKFSVEVIAKNSTVSNNTMTRSGLISVNAKSVGGGLYNVKVIGNTMVDTYVGQTAGYNRYYGCIHVHAVNPLNGVLIEGNVFDGMSPGWENSDFIYVTATPLPPLPNTTNSRPMLFNLDIVGNEFLNVRRNAISFEAGGIAENVKVSDNHFTYGYNSAEVLAEGFVFTSQASISNLMFSGNFLDCRKYVGYLPDPSLVYGGGFRLANTGAYRNVSVTGNNFAYAKSTVLIQQQVDGLLVTDNLLGTYTTGISVVTQTSPKVLIASNVQ